MPPTIPLAGTSTGRAHSNEEDDEKIYETGVLEKNVLIDWSVNNFNLVRQLDSLIAEQQIESSVTDALGVKTNWKLALVRINDEWIGLNIILLSSSGPPDKKTRNRCVVTVDGVSKLCGKRIHEWVPNANLLYHHFISKDWRPATGNLLIQMDMTIFAVLTSRKRKAPEAPENPVKTFNHHYRKRVCAILSSLACDSATSDTKIISRDGKQCQVHRFILAKASPVFGRMFQTEMLEKNSGVIKCADLSGDCIQFLMNFIYTGKLPERVDVWTNPEALWELTYAAEKYQLESLVGFLNENLADFVKAEEAPKFLHLANKIGLKKAEVGLYEVIKNSTANPQAFLKLAASMKD